MKASHYHFAKRVIEITPLSNDLAMPASELINYILGLEDTFSKEDVSRWLRYYSSKPGSILRRDKVRKSYYLDTTKAVHKLSIYDIVPRVKKIFTKLSDFSERDQIIVRKYKKGLTLKEIGDELGLTRERVRQILIPAKNIGLIPKRRKHVISKAALISMSEKGMKRRGMQERFPRRNALILDLTKKGLSRSDVAKELKISRSTVCAVVYRQKRKMASNQ